MSLKKKINFTTEVALKTMIGFLPAPVSAAFNAICDGIKESILSKRAEKWKNDVISRLDKLEINYDTLINNDAFATLLIKTTDLAIKTELDEKRTILADALINSTKLNYGEDKILIFLSIIEKYTILHIKVIKYIHDEYNNESFSCGKNMTFMALFRMHFSDVEDAYLRKVIKDLMNDYLIEECKYDARIYSSFGKINLLTKLGEDFYNFLKPVE